MKSAQNELVSSEFASQMRRRGYTDAQIKEAVAGGAKPPRTRPLPSPPAPTGVLATHGGRFVSLHTPDPATIALDDIAHGLAAICRFSGQTRTFYSVAQHSLMVAMLVPPRLRLHALLHDATEAYLQDIPSPLKALLPDYVVIEKRLDAAILSSFGLPELSSRDHAEVKHADLVAVGVEMRDLFDGTHLDPYRAQLPKLPRGMEIHRCLTPHAAKQAFLAAYANEGRWERAATTLAPQ